MKVVYYDHSIGVYEHPELGSVKQHSELVYAAQDHLSAHLLSEVGIEFEVASGNVELAGSVVVEQGSEELVELVRSSGLPVLVRDFPS